MTTNIVPRKISALPVAMSLSLSDLLPVDQENPSSPTGYSTRAGTIEQLAELVGAFISSAGVGVIPHEVTTSSDIGVTDQIIGLIPNSPASFTITLPLSSTRGGVPIMIVDLLGFLQAHPVSVAMSGSDNCLGSSLLTNCLDQNFMSLTFRPRASGGYFL